jgi:hypothetical protein
MQALRKPLLLLFCALLFVAKVVTAQNITKIEYFFDTDPGFGKGSAIAVTPGTDVTASFQIDINQLSYGFHKLYVRGYMPPYNVTENGKTVTRGGWSFTEMRGLYKEQLLPSIINGLSPIVAGEYFIDADPGFGKGQSVPVTQGMDLSNISFAFDITSMTKGFHQLSVRFKDANGTWSNTHTRTFYKEVVSATSAPDPATEVTYGEYFFDTDPGFGKGTPISVVPGMNHSLSFTADVTNLSKGFHYLQVRFRDAKGIWSNTHGRSFYKEVLSSITTPLAKINKLEYFVDTDPGFGKGMPVNVTPAHGVDDFEFLMDMTNISIGNHKLYVRAQDENGVWSMIRSGDFEIKPPTDLIISLGTISNTICAGSNVAIPFTVNGAYGSNNVFTAQLSDAAGNFGNNPVSVGSITGTGDNTIQATIPAGTNASANYRIRVIASSPFDTSGNSQPITIKRVPEAYLTISGTTPVCLGSTTYSASPLDPNATTYTWSLADGGTLDTIRGESVNVNWTKAGNYTLKMTASNACGSGSEKSIVVRVYAAAPTVAPVITASGKNLSISNTQTTETVNSYKWYKDGALVTNLTSSTVTPTQDGRYTVRFANSCGEGPVSNAIDYLVNKQSQTINFIPVEDTTYGQVNYVVLSATASSGLPVTLSITQGNGISNLKSDTLYITGAGNITIKASQAGNNTYAPATADMSFVVKKAAATISFSNLTQVYNGTTKQPVITTTPSGVNVTTTYNGVATKPVNAGSYKVVATISNNNYQGADSTTFVIEKAHQTITLPIIPDLQLSASSYKTGVKASSNLPVTLSLTTEPAGVATVSNDSIYLANVGKGYLVATQDGDNNYHAAMPVKDTFEIKKATQVINFSVIADKIWGSAPFALNATASSGLAVSYRLVSGPATLNNNTVTLTGLGRVVIEATQQGNDVYNAATPAQRSFAVVAYPDLFVQNVTSDKTDVGPGETVNVSWKVSNIGTGKSPVKWIERISVQAAGGVNKTVIQLTNFTDAILLDTAASMTRNVMVTLPASLNIGDQGYFAVELLPDTSVHEQASTLANNTAVQQSAWTIQKTLSLDLSATQITEGMATGVTGTIKRSGSLAASLVVNIATKYAQQITVPVSVTIPAGQAGASFTISAADNNAVEGTLLDTIKISATNFTGDSAPLSILDNDQASLTIINLPAKANEGDTVSFAVSTNLAASAPLTVYLTSSKAAKFPVPASVVIPAGSTSANVSVVVAQNTTPEIDQAIEVKAGAANHTPVTATLTVNDDDLPNLELVLQTSAVSEGAGIYATKATLRRTSTANPVAFTANLSTSLSNTLILPNSITLGANENEKTFNVGVIDNTLAEGQRQVAITASVFVSSCGCTAPPTSSGSVSTNLTINDNDGPTLTLTATPLTLPEGASNAGLLRITRNTSTASALTVDLSTSDSSEATLPGTATIPAGKAFVDVPITTLNDGTVDGSQTVYFQAKSNGFSTGSVWVVVTDQNKPDLLVSTVSLSDTSVQALSLFNYTVSVKNNGLATAPSGVVVHGYLSKDDVIDAKDSLLISGTIDNPIPVGQAANLLNAVKAPNVPGKYKLLFKVNPESTMTELLLTNNTAQPVVLNIKPDYSATAIVQPSYFLKGDTVRITGTATKVNGTAATSVPVEVYIITQGFRRTVTTTTNNFGQYTALFVPMAKEYGHYIVGASFPGMGLTDEQDAFDILGVKLNDGNLPSFLVKAGDTLSGTMKVQNLSNKALTNLSLKPRTLPNGAVIKFDTLATLAGNATANFKYKVSGETLTGGNNYQVGVLQAVAAEGIVQDQNFDYFCKAPNAQLQADISKIDAKVSVAKGEQVVEFRVVNRGTGASGEITVQLPQVNWLRSVTPKVLPSLSAGDTAVVIVKFIALPEVPFEYPIKGNIAINCTNGNGIAVPFTFEKVATSTGVASITVTDQFTYYAQGGPKVEGAHVVIKNYFTGVVYAEGMSNAAGQFVTQGIPEGKHRVVVEKDKHQSYDGTITINPGDTVSKEVFLNYQAITFNWSVVPTTVQDEYDINLEANFETNVPMPVVTMQMPKVLPQLSGSDTYAFNITLTNHGLITAQEVKISLPVDQEYEFVTNYQPMDLLAQQSIQVPVIMRRRSGSGFAGQKMSMGEFSQLLNMKTTLGPENDLMCLASAVATYLYSCGIHPVGGAAGAMAEIAGRTCDGFLGWLPNLGNVFGGSSGGQTGGGSVGGGNNNTNANGNSSTGYTNIKSNCNIDPEEYANGSGNVRMSNSSSQALSLLSKLGDNGISQNNAAQTAGAYEPPAALVEAVANRNLARRGIQLRDTINREYFGLLPKRDGWLDMYEPIEPQVIAKDSIRPALEQAVLQHMQGFEITGAEITAAFNRWNTSIYARSLAVLTPNTQYPSIINWSLVNMWSDSVSLVHQQAIQKGYTSIDDMYLKSQEAIDQIIESQKNAVCASVKVQFSQKLTMTREAFEGTLDIFNGHPTDKMDSLSVNILITDQNGVPANGLFEIQTKSLTNLSDVTGTGGINAQQNGTVKFIFIPTLNAAPTTPTAYNFGGSVRYWDPYVQAMVTMPLNAVELTVNPSPNLMLHYFMQRNILGDDPLTSPAIEPSVPAELSVMVENQGYGPAVNMAISSAQPKVTENEKGLAIDFQLIGSNFQGQPTKFGVTDINFGTIPALQTRVGQWYFTSSLLGKFVSYDASVVHANSFGNPELSLVKGVKLHELTKSMKVYGTDDDKINDFLVNDIFDVNDEPDVIYFSQGARTEKVSPATSGSFSSAVMPPSFTNTLTVKASSNGWNYIKLSDPGNGQYELVSVTRNDGQVIPLNNAWLTFVTLPVGRQPMYENKFHFVDNFSSTAAVTYTVVWKPKNTNVPKIVKIEGAPDQVAAEQVKKLTVVFDKAIDASTFTREDLNLTFQGGQNIIDNSVVITPVDTATFEVDLSQLTTGNGFYNFTAQAAGVKDIFGISGTVGKQITWTQFLTVPTVQAFKGLPVGNKAASFDTLQVLFNLPIDEATVTPQRFTITKGGVTQSGTIRIDSVSTDKKLFYLSGLGNILTQSGEYELTVDMTNIKSNTNVAGIEAQSVQLIVDKDGPMLVSIAKLDSGGLDSQHIPFARMQFNEDVVEFNTAALKLTRDGQELPLSVDQLSSTDAKTWLAGNFGVLTYPEGAYTLTLDMTHVKDGVGNSGTGTRSISWTVNRASLITIANLEVSPDLGFSNTDGITAGDSLMVSFNVSNDATQVTISQVDIGSETVLTTVGSQAAGAVSIPVTSLKGGNTSLRVTATGMNGGMTTATKDLFIDKAPLTGQWQFANSQSVTQQVDAIPILFSSKLLNNTGLLNNVQLKRNDEVLSTSALSFQQINDTVYNLVGLTQASNTAGNYQLVFNLQALSKYSSGIKGTGNASVSWTVLSQNRAPVANAGNDVTVNQPGIISLNAASSSDPDGNTITYHWVAPEGVTLNDSTSATPTFNLTSADNGKIYTFLLIVSDGDLFSTAKVNVTYAGCAQVMYYVDNDGDGFGNSSNAQTGTACTPPTGYVTRGGDCDDNNATVYPGSGDECNTCASEVVFYSAQGTSFQWQVNDGSGFKNIQDDAVYAGTKQQYLQLTEPPTSWNGYSFRCVVIKNGQQSFSPERVLKITYTWKGAANSDWENPANWSCNKLPDEFTDVKVPAGVPLILNSAAKVRSITLSQGSQFTIKQNASLEVKK